MFVLDDGWFGTRSNDKAGLGDWKVNRSRQKDVLRSRILKDTASVADDLYEEKLRINCELEKNQFGN